MIREYSQPSPGAYSRTTGQPLGIRYPRVAVGSLFEAAKTAQLDWCSASVEERVGVCLEMLARLGQAESLFLNAHATVHTGGTDPVHEQGFFELVVPNPTAQGVDGDPEELGRIPESDLVVRNPCHGHRL